jgi:cell division protein FtsI/penicillin-binding protein 2
MITAQQLRRMGFLAGLLLLGFAGLGYRLVELHVVRHDVLLPQSEANTRREFLFTPRRGEIRDIRGNPLAVSLPAKTVCADPSLIGPHAVEVTRALAPVLELPEARLYELLNRSWRTNAQGQWLTNRFVILKRKVPLETWEQVRRTMTNLTFGLEGRTLSRTQAQFYHNLRHKAIFPYPVDDQLRIYPNHRLASHVLGYVGMHEVEVNGQPVFDTVGVEGIERMFDRQLAGVRGWRVTEKDGKNRELVFLRQQDVEPADGLNVILTLDAQVQYIVETEIAAAARQHQPDSITCLVVRPRTGEILAMATLPDFDPNAPGDYPPDARRNRMVTDMNEPGSTFKVVVVAGALNEGLVRLEDVIFCENGAFAYGGRVLHDHHRYGNLSVEAIITKSSNIGAAKIGMLLGEQRLYDYIRAFGFGERTGVSLPGEVSGMLYAPKHWEKVKLAQIPMGHGLAVTRMQMAYAMCAIANRGVLMRPLLVDRLEDNDGRVVAKYTPQPVRQVIKPEAAAQMVRALKTVVTREGTAYKARLEHYSCAGKTGTAQKPEAGGYSHEKYYSSFIGFFPADDPEVCVSVVMDYPKHGYYGGEVCGPVFQRIAERIGNYLNLRPDLESPAPGGTPIAARPAGRPLAAPVRN